MANYEKQVLLKLVEYKMDTAKLDIQHYEFLSDEQLKSLLEFVVTENEYLQRVHSASLNEPIIYNKAFFLDYIKFKEKVLKKETDFLRSLMGY